MHKNKRYYTYILICADGTLYTGYTDDIDRRVALHNSGRAAKYTRGRTPVTLAYAEQAASRSDALSREAQIKRLTRKEKLELIQGY